MFKEEKNPKGISVSLRCKNPYEMVSIGNVFFRRIIKNIFIVLKHKIVLIIEMNIDENENGNVLYTLNMRYCKEKVCYIKIINYNIYITYYISKLIKF